MSQNYRNALASSLENYIDGENDVFKGMYNFTNEQSSCNSFPQYNFFPSSQGFFRTTASNYTLENGTYPIFLRYTNPLDEAVYQSPSINISRNSGSD